MPQSPDAVIKNLKSRSFAPVYFLQGDEPFYIDLITDLIEKHALSESEKSFNQTICYGKDITVGGVLNNARRFPMMSEKTVVIVKEAQEILDLGKEEAQNMLEKYIMQPLVTTILVFAHKNKTLDGRKSITKTLDKQAVLVDSKKIYDNKLPDWIINYVKEKQLSIQPDAAQILANNIGNDLSRLSNEIEKLCLNLKDTKSITADLVQKYIGISKEYNTFELQKALIQKNALKANEIILYFESNPKQNPIIPIIAILFNFFSKVMLVHQAFDKSDSFLAKALGVNPFFVKDYTIAAKNYNLHKIINIINYLSEADLQSKGIDSVKSESEILKELIFKIIH